MPDGKVEDGGQFGDVTLGGSGGEQEIGGGMGGILLPDVEVGDAVDDVDEGRL